MDQAENVVRNAFRLQAGSCRRLGSPLTAELCEVVGERLDRGTEVGRSILDWEGQPDANGDSVPLRLAGALHALVRRGAVPRLADLYPPKPLPNPDTLWQTLHGVFAEHPAELVRWLNNPPQTNEVARAAVLMSGLLAFAARFGLPLSLYELGSSAGLNLVLDRYAYRLGGLRAGAAHSKLFLEPAWTGSSPPIAKVRIARRRGVDRAPLDVRNAPDRERLASYIWADQLDRLARIKAAIEIAAADPPVIDRAEAADWVERTIAEAPEPGIARVLMHSITFQYFSSKDQLRVADHVSRVGRLATPDSPFAWLHFEVSPHTGLAELRLRYWPDGTETLLATGDPHGQTIEWQEV